METKTLKIEIPNGYEIDKEKSTFENIVFKKVDEVVIKWDKSRNGVEIKADGEQFLLSGSPNYNMTWTEAMRFYSEVQFYKLPTIKQLQVVYKYFDKINEVIEENGGFVLNKSVYWCIEQYDEFCALSVNMCNGAVRRYLTGNITSIRAVSTL